jgi:hypothetical protein
MYLVDITADLNDEDEAGYVWTFLDEARDPARISPELLSWPATKTPPRCARSWTSGPREMARSSIFAFCRGCSMITVPWLTGRLPAELRSPVPSGQCRTAADGRG